MKRDYGDTIMSWRVSATLGDSDAKGMGESYEKSMKNMVDAGLDYIDKYPNTDKMTDDMYNDMIKADPGCSNASFDEALGHVWYIKQFGLNKFISEMEGGRQAHILRRLE